jgi:hypothetical protein
VASFPILFGKWRPLLVAVGMGPGVSGVDLDDGELHIRLGWAFRARIPRSSITGAKPVTGRVGGVGVHGWRGRWLVNGSFERIVEVDIDPPARALATGFPVKLRSVLLSLEDPEGFVSALTR